MASFVYLFSLGFLMCTAWYTQAPPNTPPVFASHFDTNVVMQGTVVAPPDAREGSVRLVVDTGIARVLAVAPLRTAAAVGDEVRITGMLVRPEPFETDGGHTFRYDHFLAKDGIIGLIDPASVEITGRSARVDLNILRILGTVHDTFIAALERALPQPQSALAAGIIAGGKQGLGKELLEAFTVAGMLQIVVLSGYNVMIVANGVLRLVSFLPPRPAFACALAALAAFVLAAGAGSAALRAGLMAILALWARTFGHTHNVLCALCISLIALLIWNPYLLLHDPGLQLSFVATLGLILGTPVLEPLLARIPGAGLRELIGTTVAAQIAVLPLLLYQSGNLSLISFLANVLAAPAIPWAMAASAISAGLTYILPGFMVHMLAVPAYLLLSYVLAVAEISASLPFAQIMVPAFPLWVIGAAYLVLAWSVYTKTPARAGVLGKGS